MERPTAVADLKLLTQIMSRVAKLSPGAKAWLRDGLIVEATDDA